MPTANGVVTKISTKEVTTKYGAKPTFGVQVNGAWYNCGFKQPACKEGDTVDIVFTEGKYGKDVSSIGTSSGSSTPSNTTGSGTVSNDARQASIIRQNSLAHATNLIIATRGKTEGRTELVKEILRYANVFVAYSDGSMQDTLESTATDLLLAPTTTNESDSEVPF